MTESRAHIYVYSDGRLTAWLPVMTLTVRNDNDYKREIGSVAGIKANFHREYLRQDLRANMYKLGPVRAKIFFPAFVERQTCPGDIYKNDSGGLDR